MGLSLNLGITYNIFVQYNRVEFNMNESLPDLNSSVDVNANVSFFRRLIMFSGPAFMVAVGYMDPGNWATDLAAGAKFGYKLLWVILLANIFAILFQTLSARLGIVTGRDLAQSCRDHYPRPINYLLWFLCEIAIAACDLAEVLGSAIGLYLLFHIPLLWGVIITTLDVLVLMGLLSLGIRKMEAFILALITTIAFCFAAELLISKPNAAEILTGFMPSTLHPEALFIALGIIGATVMPHNLYLHSALVQSRNYTRNELGKKQANTFNFIDSFIALNGALFVNAAILIVAASMFFKNNLTEVASIIDAHKLLASVVGSSIAPIAFGIALLAAGQSSTITGTFAGQIIMEGFLGLQIRPWIRRLITRVAAVTPALIVIYIYGDSSVDSLLIVSQVVLSLQLPFAVIPLLHFTSSRRKMNVFANKLWAKIFAWTASILTVLLNIKFVYDLIADSFANPKPESSLIQFILLPFACLAAPLLVYIIFEPSWRNIRVRALKRIKINQATIDALPVPSFKKIGIALEGDHDRDIQILNLSLPIVKSFSSEIVLIHCVQTATGRYAGNMVGDSEAYSMEYYLTEMKSFFEKENLIVKTVLGGGDPEEEIVRIARNENLDMIIAGSHGHRFISDLIYGSTVNGVRHKTRLPVLAFPIN